MAKRQKRHTATVGRSSRITERRSTVEPDHTRNIIVREEELPPSEFLAVFRKDPGSIKHATVVAPRLGSSGFGRIKVIYNIPRLKRA